MAFKLDKQALTIAARKIRKLRLEDVGGRKERPAETVGSMMDRMYYGSGSLDAQEYILKHAIRYYYEALETLHG